MAIIAAHFALDRFLVLSQSYFDAKKQNLRNAWFRVQCQDRTFRENVQAHTDICAKVSQENDKNIYVASLHAAIHTEYRPFDFHVMDCSVTSSFVFVMIISGYLAYVGWSEHRGDWVTGGEFIPQKRMREAVTQAVCRHHKKIGSAVLPYSRCGPYCYM